MKDMTLAKAIYIALALLVVGMFIAMAVDYIGSSEDGIITEKRTVENY